MNSIHTLAYEIWESRGRPNGSADSDWFEAERRLRPNNGDADGVPMLDRDLAVGAIREAEEAGLPGDSVVLPAESI